jgi:hypothetical protein
MHGYTTNKTRKTVNIHWKSRSAIFLLAALAVMILAWFIASTGGTALAQTGGNYRMTRSVISAGGDGLTGGIYTLAGTIGQPDAGVLKGGIYTLGGGFLSSGSTVRISLPLVSKSN